MPCYACQAAVAANDRFCVKCGQPIPQRPPRPAGQYAAVLGDFDVDGLSKLREEKSTLSKALQDMFSQIGGRDMSAEERADWNELRERWRAVSDEITKRMQQFNARADFDRRAGDRRKDARRRQRVSIDVQERRAGKDRREKERRDTDRRDPYPPAPRGKIE